MSEKENLDKTRKEALPQVNTLLLVDDNPLNLQVLFQSLKDEGYRLLVAKNGQEAIRIARERQPQIVLLDIMMPELDGYEACEVLLKDPKTKDTAIIFLSALQGTEEKIRGLSLGAVDYITKPFDGDEVKARVRRQVELWEEKQKLRLENSRLMLRSSESSQASPDQEKQVRTWIEKGETEHTEFKSTLRWSLTKNQVDRGVEVAWLKTVAAFLNSGGGTLIVGVGDKGEILGIKKDNFPNEDKYLLHVNNRIQQHIGLEHAQNIEYSLVPIDQEKVLVIECKPSSVPVFFVQGNEESFYIRVGPGSRKLSISQALTYLSEREKSLQED